MASPVSKPNTIHCCSEHSEYDPASGARVLNGPAPQPLSAILLEYEPGTDGLYAVGTLGGELFNAFFAKYELKLELDYGSGRAKQRVADAIGGDRARELLQAAGSMLNRAGGRFLTHGRSRVKTILSVIAAALALAACAALRRRPDRQRAQR